MATTPFEPVVLPSFPFVQRYILRSEHGYLADTVSSSAEFCARQSDARVFYLRRYAQAQADKYGLEIILLPPESAESDASIFADTEKSLSALELLARFCVESSKNSTYVGIQPAFYAKGVRHSAVVLWNSKATGSTLGCKLEVLSTARVRQITEASDRKFAQFADANSEIAWG